ncbi:MarR family transcriptional regulator [Svornostia abyssi]|uniref:MarR family transcriptional regulator n=1 Tax=Svornostia abyssi TaxID=2898438 RepID=A0ABY5PM64_9ACTN|nr:MarR family transcriptional regulator [Parviterribacteraceae bacterium J379]
MTDFLEEKKQEIEARLAELRPLVEEYERLEAASRALNGLDGAQAAPSSSRRRRSGGGGSGRRGRPKGSGTRGTQALDLVKANPGIAIPELAEKMGIKQNYLYRVLPGLEQDGLVEKRDRGWYAKEAA